MTSSTAALTALSPADIDGQLFPILDQLGGKEANRQSYQDRLDGKPRYPGAHVWPMTDRERAQYEEAVATFTRDIEALDAEAAPFEAEFTDRGGWTRYIVVPGGHLHKRGCHTLTPGRTMVGQVAEASGMDEGAVVGKYDEQACTHCFPNAPVAEKLTPAEEGFCEHSGEFAPQEKLPEGWMSRHYMPSVRCECGHLGSITTTGKFRKHKTGRKD